MDGLLVVEDGRNRAYHERMPTRSETNRKICVAVTAAVAINTLICAFMAIYVFSTLAKASPSDKLPETSAIRQEAQTQLARGPDPTSKPKPPHRAHLKGRVDAGHMVWKPNFNSNMVYNETLRSLQIPKDGFYNIYLQVVYRNAANKPCDEYLSLKHEVVWKSVRYGGRTPPPIITAMETVPCTEKTWYRTMVSVAQHEFMAGDELEVQGINPDFVDMGGKVHTKHFWGVYLYTDIY